MARQVILFTAQWVDLPLEELAKKASDWGFQGFELCCWGDHFEVPRAISQEGYCQQKLDMLAEHGLLAPVLSNHRVSQAIADCIDVRHKNLVPDYIWGDGVPDGVRDRAREEMKATILAAEKMGIGIVAGFTGSPLWSYVAGYPLPSESVVTAGFRECAQKWNPILDCCRDHGIKYALEIHPGQMAFDLYSAEMLLDALGGREELNFALDPSHLHWQGVDPVEFIRRFPERIIHVQVKDALVTLNGRTSLLNSYCSYGDWRRGWQPRAPGHGGIDWEAIIRSLNDIGYQGSLAVEWNDSGMDRDFGVEEACKFTKRLDYEPAPKHCSNTFHDAL
jgi:sugar phosphate isomerase/epimerase